MQWYEQVRPFPLVPIPRVVLTTSRAISTTVPDHYGVLQGLEGHWSEVELQLISSWIVELDIERLSLAREYGVDVSIPVLAMERPSVPLGRAR